MEIFDAEPLPHADNPLKMVVNYNSSATVRVCTMYLRSLSVNNLQFNLASVGDRNEGIGNGRGSS